MTTINPPSEAQARQQLIEAAEAGDMGKLEEFLPAVSNLDKASQIRGHPPLHFALFNRQFEAADRLLAAGASLEATDKEGLTAMQLAANAGATEFLDKLIADGADLEGRGDPRGRFPATTNLSGGSTPLLVAAQNDQSQAAQRLIASGADVNATTNPGDTVLHFAAANRDADLVQAAVAAGADPDALNNLGVGPRTFAETHDWLPMFDQAVQATLTQQAAQVATPTREVADPTQHRRGSRDRGEAEQDTSSP